MRRFLSVLALVLVVFPGVSAFAQTTPLKPGAVTRNERNALFRRTLTPSWIRGANGYLTAPNAHTIGHFSVAGQAWVQDSGNVQAPGFPEKKVYTNYFSVFIGTSDDVEFGATKKVLTYDDFTREGLNVEASILHFKARALKLHEFLPVVAVGLNAVDVADPNGSKSDTFVDVYAVVTQTIKLGPIWLNGSLGIQKGLMGERSSENHFFAAAQLNLTRHLFVCAELVGASERTAQSGSVELGKDAILNIGAGINLTAGGFAELQVGGDIWNASKSVGGDKLSKKASDLEFGVHVALTLHFGGGN